MVMADFRELNEKGIYSDGNRQRTEAESADEHPSVMISSDRYSVSVRLVSKDSYAEYKRAAADRTFIGSCDQAELFPATVTPDGYVCSIRGRATLKEIVSGTDVLGIRALKALAVCLRKLIASAAEHGIDPGDFVYDYNAVMVRNIEADYKFVYMPGLKNVKERTTAGELIRILFLNIDTGDATASDCEKLGDRVRNISPDENSVKMLDSLDLLIETAGEMNSDTTFGEKLLGLLKHRYVKAEAGEKAGTLTVSVKGYGGLGDVDLERRVRSGGSLPLKIGRDGEWADIQVPDLFASRKHAEIEINGEGKLSVTDLSMNGLCVDGEKTGPFSDLNVKEKEVRIDITENCGIAVKGSIL